MSFQISTHALTEGDLTLYTYVCLLPIFQLTPSRRATAYTLSRDPPGIFQLTPSRRATVSVLKVHTVYDISTHALTEGDDKHFPLGHCSQHFNSRPHGGRLRNTTQRYRGGIFQLTPSRRATIPLSTSFYQLIFQLTPSRRATETLFKDSADIVFQLTPSRRATTSSHKSTTP